VEKRDLTVVQLSRKPSQIFESGVENAWSSTSTVGLHGVVLNKAYANVFIEW
jgi:hypothetical protein